MENTLYIALSRQNALWHQLDMVGNNLANMNTPAYKNMEPVFDSFLAKTKSDDSSFGERISYVHDFGIVRNFESGELIATGNPLDIAIHGNGYFSVAHERLGEVYSRNGRFTLDGNGMMVTSEGYPVLNTQNEPIFIAPTEKDISVAQDGTVSTENGIIGKIKISAFKNQQMMREYYGGHYGTDIIENPPMESSSTVLEQGMVEQSNVKPVVEMTNMINVQRAYEGVQRLIEAEHTRKQKAMDAFIRKGNK